jgi:DNA-binding protein HU-beta
VDLCGLRPTRTYCHGCVGDERHSSTVKQRIDLEKAAEAETFGALAVSAGGKHQGVAFTREGSPKSRIAAAIAEKNGITKKQAIEILETIAELAYQQAKDTFTLPGLGKLVLVDRAARIGRNPATGEQIQIPAKRVVKFRVAKAAKDAILGSQ